MIEITSAKPQGPRLTAALLRCCLVWLLAVWQLPGLAQPAELAQQAQLLIAPRQSHICLRATSATTSARVPG